MEALTLESVHNAIAKVEDHMLSGLPPILLESWGRELCLKFISCELHEDKLANAIIFTGGKCKWGELFMLKGDTLMYFPPPTWPEQKFEFVPEFDPLGPLGWPSVLVRR